MLVLADAGLFLLPPDRHQPNLCAGGGGGMFVFLLAGRAISHSGVYWMRERLNRYHYCLIVGCGSRAREVAA